VTEVQDSGLARIFFFYGLAFFCMGLAILLEVGRTSDPRLRHALPRLAAFGVCHGLHEWIEMFLALGVLPWAATSPREWETFRVALLAVSFVLLGAFGASLLSPDERWRSRSWFVPLSLTVLWAAGMLVLNLRIPDWRDLVSAADVWTRYMLAVPSALLAAAGLVTQRQVYERAGMPQFGLDCLVAAIAFAVYGLVGQIFTRASVLPTSQVLNQQVFAVLFGFPVQLLRALAAVVASFFVIRFMRSFEVQTQRQIAELQAAQLTDARRREAMRREYLRRLVTAQEAERQRIARELHDETGQALTAIGLGLRGISGMLRMDENKARQNIGHLEGLVTHSLDELQRLIGDLRPSHLDDLGLPATLRWYANEVQSRTGLQVTVEISGDLRPIPSAANTALFRLAQEALTNVVKHAEAGHARMRIAYGEKEILLQVEDDGRGFDITRVRDQASQTWGLVGMEERAGLLGGEFKLESVLGKGTCVSISFPYRQATEGLHDNSIVAD
jgi:signal transduction histidine kinase